MIGQIIVVADGKTGGIAVVERDPTHFEVRGPEDVPGGRLAWVASRFRSAALAATPGNERIVRSTSTLAREARMGELVRANTGRIDAAKGTEMLRDTRLAGGLALPPGDRRAIDAQITTHSVVADATARILYIAEGPHAGGEVRAIDLAALLEKASVDHPAE